MYGGCTVVLKIVLDELRAAAPGDALDAARRGDIDAVPAHGQPSRGRVCH